MNEEQGQMQERNVETVSITQWGFLGSHFLNPFLMEGEIITPSSTQKLNIGNGIIHTKPGGCEANIENTGQFWLLKQNLSI